MESTMEKVCSICKRVMVKEGSFWICRKCDKGSE